MSFISLMMLSDFLATPVPDRSRGGRAFGVRDFLLASVAKFRTCVDRASALLLRELADTLSEGEAGRPSWSRRGRVDSRPGEASSSSGVNGMEVAAGFAGVGLMNASCGESRCAVSYPSAESLSGEASSVSLALAPRFGVDGPAAAPGASAEDAKRVAFARASSRWVLMKTISSAVSRSSSLMRCSSSSSLALSTSSCSSRACRSTALL
jgi:hypothetical protein